MHNVQFRINISTRFFVEIVCAYFKKRDQITCTAGQANINNMTVVAHDLSRLTKNGPFINRGT